MFLPKFFIKTFSVKNVFMVAKSLPRKQVPTKNFHQKCFGWKLVWSQNHFLETDSYQKFSSIIFWWKNFWWSQHHFLENRFQPKNFHQFFLVENVLWSQNHFLENKFLLKIFIKFVWSKIFYYRKITSSKTGSYWKFSSNFFGRKFFMVAKSFPPKQGPTKNFHQIFLVES